MALHKALAFANERDQEFATLEHLLLALIDEKDAAAVMRACNVDLDRLRADVTRGEVVDFVRNWVELYRDGVLPREAATSGHAHVVELYQNGRIAVAVTGAISCWVLAVFLQLFLPQEKESRLKILCNPQPSNKKGEP